MTEKVTFNGFTLSDFYQVVDIRRPIPGRDISTQEVSGVDGVVITGSVMSSIRISVTIIIGERSVTERREEIRKLTSMLHTDEPSELIFASDDGLYYKAMLDGNSPVSENVRTDAITVNFRTESPVMYGVTRTVQVPSNGSVTFFTEGTYPASINVSGTVSGEASTGYIWGIRLDDGDYMRIETATSTPKSISINSGERTATIDGAVTLPTLDSDWLMLEPGLHTIENDVGSGSCVVTWQERWR